MKEDDLQALLESMSDVLFPDSNDRSLLTVHTHGTNGDTPLHAAAWRGDARAVQLLLQAGAPIDAKGKMGQTALHVAVMRNDTEMAEILLAAGANPDVRSEFDETFARDGGR